MTETTPSGIISVESRSARAANVHFGLRRALRARATAIVARALSAVRSALRAGLAPTLEWARRTIEAAVRRSAIPVEARGCALRFARSSSVVEAAFLDRGFLVEDRGCPGADRDCRDADQGAGLERAGDRFPASAPRALDGQRGRANRQRSARGFRACEWGCG